MIPAPLTQLDLPLEAQENWSRNWELSQASFPKEGVFFVPGSCFGSEKHLRLGFTCDCETMRTGLEKLNEFLENL